jgi:hypothetical protein
MELASPILKLGTGNDRHRGLRAKPSQKESTEGTKYNLVKGKVFILKKVTQSREVLWKYSTPPPLAYVFYLFVCFGFVFF